MLGGAHEEALQKRGVVSGRDFGRATKPARIDLGFTGCGKTQDGGRRGFQSPHKANRINVALATEGRFFGPFARYSPFFRSLFSPCGNVGIQKDTGSNPPLHDFLNGSAPNQNGEIVKHRNHLQLEEDNQFKRVSTAVSRIIGRVSRTLLLTRRSFRIAKPAKGKTTGRHASRCDARASHF